MKYALAAGLTASLVSSVAATGTFSLSLSKRDARNGKESEVAKGMLYKRQVSSAQTVEESLYDVLTWSTGGAYYTNITVGTPPQLLTVILDTGSSDLYLDASGAQDCENENLFNSCRGGSFDTSKSSTYKVVDQGGFNTSFGDGSTATGDFSTDVVGLGDVQVSNVQMGIATSVDSTTGYAVSLMGLGYSANEAATIAYPNMPEVLHNSGAINSRLYSVFLNELGDATGTILFGGIDTSKYTGELYTLDFLPFQEQNQEGEVVNFVYQFVVAVTGVRGTANGKTTSYLSNGDANPTLDGRTTNSLPVLLDTGSSAWTLPTSYYNEISSLWGDALNQDGTIACSAQNDDITLAVEFGGEVTINVPARDLIVPVYNPDTNQQNTTANGEPLCILMLSPDSGGEQMQESGFLTLGDAVLRSMYLVYDLDNGQVSIAQAIANASTDASSSGSGSNIKVVQAGPNGVASAVGSANSGVSTAPSNTNSIDQQVSTSKSYGLTTVTSAVGTATGTFAIPQAAQATGTAAAGSTGPESTGASSGTKTGSSTTSSSTSKGAASGLRAPELEWSALSVGAVWIVALGLGAGLVL